MVPTDLHREPMEHRAVCSGSRKGLVNELERDTTHRPRDLHRGGAQHHGVVHGDHHVAQLLLHAAVVNPLCCWADVWGSRDRSAVQ